jgi:hypothetical protein
MKLGSTNINKVYLGSTEITKMYLGDNIVWDGLLEPTLFDQIIGLREDGITPCGRQSINTLKVPGIDSMPTGWSIDGYTLYIGSAFSGDIEDWDFTNFSLYITSLNIGHIRNNIFKQTVPGIGFRFIDVTEDGAIQSIQYNTFEGPANYWGVGEAINFRVSGTDRDSTIGECPLIAYNRFFNLSGDVVKNAGTKAHAAQVFEWNYFGVPVNVPQYEPATWNSGTTYSIGDYVKDTSRNVRGMISKVNDNTNNLVPTGTTDNDYWTVVDPHSDGFQTMVSFGRTDIRRNLFDFAKPEGIFNAGVTNALRLARDLGVRPYDEINVDENIIYWEFSSDSPPITVASGVSMDDFVGPIKIRNNWLQPRIGPNYFSPDTNGNVDEWTNNLNIDTLEVVVGPTLRIRDFRVMVMGQSELEYLFNTTSFYTAIPYPSDYGNGNLIVVTQGDVDAAPVSTTVNTSSISAETINPAMAAMSALFSYLIPSKRVIIGDGAVVGTSRYDLADNSVTTRKFSDFVAVVNAIEGTYGNINSLVECWYNSDASSLTTFKECFWPFYFGRTHTNGAFTLGNTNPSAVVTDASFDNCLWDGAAATNTKGRGIFTRDDTKWRILSPLPFHDSPISPTTEWDNFSHGNPRVSEPARQTIINLEENLLSQTVDLIVGPSAHITNFEGGIHPSVSDPDGQILLMWPIAIAILRDAGVSIAEPTIVGIEGPTDGTYVDILVDLPNGGTLSTLREFREEAMPGTPSPHQQEVTGFEITRGTRRPVYRTSETSYPADFRGTVTIQDTGTGTVPTRRGKVRIIPTNPFEFGQSISYLRGQASAHLLNPRDTNNKIYMDMLIEHVPSLYNASSTYPLEGIAIRPYQGDLEVLVPSPDFEPMSTRFNGTTSKLVNNSLSFSGTDEGTVAFWVYVPTSWEQLRTLFNIRLSGGGVTLTVLTDHTGRLRFNLTGVDGYTTPSSTFSTDRWHHVIWSYRAGSGGWNNVSVDGSGTLLTATSLTSATLSINGSQAMVLVGTEDGGGGFFDGDLGHVYINLNTAIDLTVQANREKFILAGEPVNLGGNGQLPTGSTPEFYFNGGASMQNLGSAGTLTPTDLTLGGTPSLP